MSAAHPQLGLREEAEQHALFRVVLVGEQHVAHECVDVVHSMRHPPRFVFDLPFLHRGVETSLKIGLD